MNNDMIQATKLLLTGIKTLRPESDEMNRSIMAQMEAENPDLVSLFPKVLEVGSRMGEVMIQAFSAIDWEAEGNTLEQMQLLMNGEAEVIPDEIRDDIATHLEDETVTEHEMIARFGENPAMACIQKLGLEDAFQQQVEEHQKVMELQRIMKSLENGFPSPPPLPEELKNV